MAAPSLTLIRPEASMLKSRSNASRTTAVPVAATEYVNASPSASVAATTPTTAPAAVFSSTGNAAALTG